MGEIVSLKGLVSFAVGGVLLILAIYLVVWGALSETRIQYSSHGPLINGLILGFAAFILLGVGLYFIIESAVSSKK
ncbi:MAG: hypothetical protein OEY90_05485 [Candidatus Bathyarchaeota archaeon]|nr:hypothetical protein [Candidatus Bathyarchaeota archaeon]